MTWRYHGDPRPDVQRLVEASGARVLDVGCAEGALGSALKAAGARHVAGIEMDPAAAEVARSRLDLLITGDVRVVALPFERGEFDYLIFADVLEHAPDPDLVLHRLLPFLRSGGRVVVSVPNTRFYSVLLRLIVDRWSYTDSGVRDRTHLRVFTRGSLERMLHAHGLVLERMERNFRLLEDQSEIGRLGALATRLVAQTVAPVLFPDLLAFQYIAVARASETPPRRRPRAC
jgi:2-polyprenyl-3-methyl-5-hydroxy-6-metoxy-1,4-benzoquinol methylase